LSVLMDQVTQPFAPALPSLPLRNVPLAPSRVPAVLFWVWLCGFAVAGFKWFRGWRRIQVAARAASPLSQDLPIGPIPIPVMCSPVLMEPSVFGILRPVLLLSEGILHRLTPDQLKAILIHELFHVRRRDNLAATIHMMVETLFWFYPLVWWIGTRLLDERERACDEEVLRVIGEQQPYAEGILTVCKFCLESSPLCAAGVTGSNLKKRIEAIMRNRVAVRLNFGKKVLLAGAGTAAVFIPLAIGVINAPSIHAQAQNSTRLQFEVASVKRNNSGSQPSLFRPATGRFSAENVSVQQLLWWAYNVQDFQIMGGPGWIDSDHYDIEAKADPNQQMRPMLQTLLQDRFKLVLHRDTKELPVYVLTVAKNGPKLKAGTCITSDPNTPPAPGQRQSAFCGFGVVGNNNLTATSTRMDIFTDLLATVLKRRVIDKTGFAGNFDVSLRWTPDQVPVGNPAAPSADTGGPSIFTAIQEQLGLKLESDKGPVDVLVIDNLERPSEN
jgi:bla regulator protein BlaR1